MEQEQRVSPMKLLTLMGVTPADNREGFDTAIPWKSKIAGEQVKFLFHYQKLLESISGNPHLYGPFAIAAIWQKAMLKLFVTEPIKALARLAVRAGRSPDFFEEVDRWIYENYAQLLYNFWDFFMTDDKFDREKALHVSSTQEGKEFLKNYLRKFAWFEYIYNSIGLTTLKAMKELLKCMLIVITEKPLDGEELPFMKKKGDGSNALSFSEYIEENRIRLENLYRENAFDIVEFSERATRCRIGYSAFEIVEGSKLYSVTLRHYLLPEGVKWNGKVIYMATPLINMPEIFDLAKGKSVVEGMLKEGYEIYLVDHGEPGPDESKLGLDFYGKTIHDWYLGLIKALHPGVEIEVMAYCMAGTLILPYLARRAEERIARGETMDIKKVALMASPVRFDDAASGHGPMRQVIRRYYDPLLMEELFGSDNIPPQVIDYGMHEIQPGVEFTVTLGFYERDLYLQNIQDSASFLYWLTHGTKFPARAHREWIESIFIGNQICEGEYCLPSTNPALHGRPVNMDILQEAGVTIFDYRGRRDSIAPAGSCVASELWGQVHNGNVEITRGWLNRTIEKNIGHIFVVSKQLLEEYLTMVSAFFKGENI